MKHNRNTGEFYCGGMKTIFLFLIILFAGSSAWSQASKIMPAASANYDSVKVADNHFNRKFLGNGNTLLNVGGSIPDHIVTVSTKSKENPAVNYLQADKLIARTLLFRGKLVDHLSQPFWIIPEPARNHTPAPEIHY
jgi:hypothetical protein